jgi:probable HAF family extracellular repeat protein
MARKNLLRRLMVVVVISLALGGSPAGVQAGPYTFYDLGTLGGSSSQATGINASGQVVGSSYLAGDASYHAFLYPFPGGSMQDLGTLGGSSSVAYGINASGQVAGWADTASGGMHAFLYPYPGGPMQDLCYGQAYGINASGQVVGSSGSKAFLYPYPGGPMQDLGSLGGNLSEAKGINAGGQVVGWLFLAGDASYHAFLYP